jgi:hypothetical protein
VVVLGRKIVLSLWGAFILACVSDSTGGCAAVLVWADATAVAPNNEAITTAGIANLDRMTNLLI